MKHIFHIIAIITLNKKNLTLEYFQVSSISNPKHRMAISTGYLANYDKKIIFVTGDGNMYYISHNDFAKDEFNATKIPNNLKTLMNYKEFNQKSMYGIKDLFITGNDPKKTKGFISNFLTVKPLMIDKLNKKFNVYYKAGDSVELNNRLD